MKKIKVIFVFNILQMLFFFQNKELEPEITELKEKLKKKTNTFFSLIVYNKVRNLG